MTKNNRGILNFFFIICVIVVLFAAFSLYNMAQDAERIRNNNALFEQQYEIKYLWDESRNTASERIYVQKSTGYIANYVDFDPETRISDPRFLKMRNGSYVTVEDYTSGKYFDDVYNYTAEEIAEQNRIKAEYDRLDRLEAEKENRKNTPRVITIVTPTGKITIR